MIGNEATRLGYFYCLQMMTYRNKKGSNYDNDNNISKNDKNTGKVTITMIMTY